MKKEGDSVSFDGRPYILGRKIGGGLEGSVFELADIEANGTHRNDWAIKIINTSKMTDLQKNDLFHNLKRKKLFRESYKSLKKWLALPIYLLEGDDIGYVMTKASGYSNLNKYISCPDNTDYEDWILRKHTLLRRYEIIRSMFQTLREIHICGLIFTDLSPKNILVDDVTKENFAKRRQIVFIDTDNMRFSDETYVSVLGTPGYMAPELYVKGNDSDSEPRYRKISVNSDVFSAAILAFELITLGHPFKGDHIYDEPVEEEEKADRCETDYVFKEGTDNTWSRDRIELFLQMTTPRIRELFAKTFIDGKDYPELRPTDLEFYDAFDEGYNLLETCPTCNFSRIIDPKAENQCINCNRSYPEKILLHIYCKFEEMSLMEGLNKICEDPFTDLDCPGIFERLDNPLGTEISRMVIDENKMRVVCGRHLQTEYSMDPNIHFKITYNSKTDTVQMMKVSRDFPNAFVINRRKKKTRYALNKDEPRLFDTDHVIVFDEKPHGKGLLITYGEFSRC